jgi:hypothetical protein
LILFKITLDSWEFSSRAWFLESAPKFKIARLIFRLTRFFSSERTLGFPYVTLGFLSNLLPSHFAAFAAVASNRRSNPYTRVCVCASTSAAMPANTIRQPTPDVDTGKLEDALARYISSIGTSQAFAFGIYSGVPLGHGVRGRGLLALSCLIQAMISAAPHLTFTHLQLKSVVTNLSFRFQELWDGKRPLDRFSADIAERLFTVCNHCRRLRHSAVRLRQAMSDLCDEEQDRLRALVESIEFVDAAMSTAPASSRPSARASSNLAHDPLPPAPVRAARAEPPARTLAAHPSTCSVDSDGFPSMLRAISVIKREDDSATVFYPEASPLATFAETPIHDDEIDPVLLDTAPVPPRKIELKQQVVKKKTAMCKRSLGRLIQIFHTS